MTVPLSRHRALIVAVFVLFLSLSCFGCSQQHDQDSRALCTDCHLRSMSCHLTKRMNFERIFDLWKTSFHTSLLRESFIGCPHRDCMKCHPDLYLY